jgi:DNA polymerase III alpha subunit (gram-positive type)
MDIDKKFVDIFQNGRKTSAIIRKSSRYSDFKATSKSLNDHPTVLFDVETTGTESNIAYSLTYSTYENGKWNKRILFTKYNPEWVIDSAVDDLNGGVGSTAKKIMEAKDAEQIFDTPQEMFEYFKTQMPEDTILIAHNARFDLNALNTILRYTTKSKYRYWFPYGTEIWDTMKMARDVIHKMQTYKDFCERHNLKTKNGRLSTTAESLYKFITNNPNFVESHTGLEDVQIEREILFYCYRQHKPMRKLLYENQSAPLEPPTELQKQIMRIVKNNA